MKRIKKIAVLVVTLFMALISSGCYVAPTTGNMILCIYSDEPLDLALVINASDSNGMPVTDDDTGVLYVDYITVGRTAAQPMPNECESSKPYHVIRLKAETGSALYASIRASGPSRQTKLECVYYINGVIMPVTKVTGTNTIVCRVTARV